MNRIFLTTLLLLGSMFVLQAQNHHFLGEKFGGGIVFSTNANGTHGLIAETEDLGIYAANMVGKAIRIGHYSIKGSKFNDWRIPTPSELKLLYKNRSLIGSLNSGMYYWSATMGFPQKAVGCINFNSGTEVTKNQFPKAAMIRLIREF